jgi:hypothetical protein
MHYPGYALGGSTIYWFLYNWSLVGAYPLVAVSVASAHQSPFDPPLFSVFSIGTFLTLCHPNNKRTPHPRIRMQTFAPMKPMRSPLMGLFENRHIHTATRVPAEANWCTIPGYALGLALGGLCTMPESGVRPNLLATPSE